MSSSSATVRVEKATSDLLIGPDWTMNMDICDSINTDQGQAKDVVKAVKKRLQHKNPKVHFLALTLLETMIKNCGDYVHFQVVDRGVLQEMIKIVRKKTDMQVRDKILVLLDSWQEAFGGPGGKYPQYYWAYTELKRSGVEFPQRSPDSALIFTPPPRHPQIGYGMPRNSSMRLDEAMASEMANLSLSDLDRHRGVMELLSDMLKAVNPSDRETVKDEVIVDLVSQCCSNQKKLLQLVNSTGDEELLGQGLALNDDLQSLLAKHDAIASGSPLPAESSGPLRAEASASTMPVESSESIPGPKTPAAPCESIPGPSTPNATTLTVMNQYEDGEEEDDDFAQLARRNSKYKPASETSSEANGQVPSPTDPSTGSTSEASLSNALALPDPPAPVKTSNKEQDMIDLLALTISSYPSPPQTPLTPPSASFQNTPPTSISPDAPGSPYLVNQGYIPYNSYIAPWAQPQPLPQPQIQSNYPPPPWEATSSSNAYPFYVPQPQQQQHQYNSFGPRVNYVPASTSATQVNPTFRQTGYGASASPKPSYIPVDKLFEDLMDIGKPSSTTPTSSGQGMIGGRK